MSLDITLLPALAPLSAPIVSHLLSQRPADQSPLRAVAALGEAVVGARDAVYEQLDPLVRADQFTIHHLRDLLRAVSPPRSEPTDQNIALWRARGVMRMRRRGVPDPQAAAAILIARRLARPERRRGWLPSEILPSEPAWWCWRVDSPAAPMLPCPLPLPPDLAPSALLWTPWRGATWLAGWYSIDGGALYVPDGEQAIDAALATWQVELDADVQAARRLLKDTEAGLAVAWQTWIKVAAGLVMERRRQT